MEISRAVVIDQRSRTGFELIQTAQDHFLPVVVPLHQQTAVEFAARAAPRRPRDEVINRPAHRAMAARGEAAQQPGFGNLQINHHRPRQTQFGQQRIEVNRLADSSRKTVQNEAFRRRIPPESRPYHFAHHLVAHQRARRQSAPQPHARRRIPLRFRPQRLARRKARHTQLRREPRTLRPLAAPGRAQKNNYARIGMG